MSPTVLSIAPLKNARSAYVFYSQANRASVIEAHPGIVSTKITKLLGTQWKACSVEQKAPYVAQALADKDRFKQDVENGLKKAVKEKDNVMSRLNKKSINLNKSK